MPPRECLLFTNIVHLHFIVVLCLYPTMYQGLAYTETTRGKERQVRCFRTPKLYLRQCTDSKKNPQRNNIRPKGSCCCFLGELIFYFVVMLCAVLAKLMLL
ncbi:unnamed protein product [Trifolium pratense]|uniref:Uncharacterized protein n=1 Tax=Trifolium pratense TaxID=57577 RepID=A0ACB0KJV7_TRIPR|nr:unnamed protein product [Trifolium pratense]